MKKSEEKRHCPYCDKLLSKSYIKTHIKKQHAKYSLPKTKPIDDNDLVDLFSDMNINDSKEDKILEKHIQKKLEKKYKCGHQYTPAGIIDLLSPTLLIEIKHWRSFKTAIGQCFAYGHYYPKHMKCIHFFGKPVSEDKKIVVLTICASLGIKVTYEKYKI